MVTDTLSVDPLIVYMWGISSNIIEGFYNPKEKIIGIQWHPERKNFNKDFDLHLFNILFNQDYDFKI